MGIPSLSEDNVRKAEEAAFMDKPMAPDLAKILASPVDTLPRVRKSKPKRIKAKKVDAKKVNPEILRQQREIARLTDENRRLRIELRAEKQHLDQLRNQQMSEGANLLSVEVRKLKAEVAKRDEEIASLHQLVMRTQID